mmetsp:Transcript_41417/g.128750  ORF Transcript_41417/g.128750 Transcript_41417/m.128750 type:complete len:266 (-) Transcript_41417:1995-2792(-)
MEIITAGMSTGHVGSDCSFRCFRSSHPRKRAKTLFPFVDNQVTIRCWIAGNACTHSAGATSMIFPMASTMVCRRLSSSVSPVSSSSSSCCSSGGAPAVFSFFWVSRELLLLKESSMNLKNCSMSMRISEALRTPGPQFFRHSPMPSAASLRVSGSSSSCIPFRAGCMKVRKSSAATPLLPSASFAHLMSKDQTWKASPRASSYRAPFSCGLRMGNRASAVGFTHSRKAPSISVQKVCNRDKDWLRSSNLELLTLTSLPSPTVMVT